MKVTFPTPKGTKTVDIQAVDVKMTEKEENKMWKQFHKEVRVIEFVGFSTYSFRGRVKDKAHSFKSCSLDELQEMFKAAWNGLPVPERKCNPL